MCIHSAPGAYLDFSFLIFFEKERERAVALNNNIIVESKSKSNPRLNVKIKKKEFTEFSTYGKQKEIN